MADPKNPVVTPVVRKSCWSCSYFHVLSEKKKAGQCRRNPPSIREADSYRASDTVIIASNWPLCYGDEWCGEYKAG